MPQESPPYKKLSSVTTTISGRHSLYLGADHLLYVANTSFVENYKRFFFADVQSLVLSGSNRRYAIYLWLSFATAGAIVVSTLVGVAASLPTGFITLGVLGSILILMFARNAWLGPTCICSISTAVQMEILRPLRRTRTATPILEQIAELVRLAPEQSNATPLGAPSVAAGGLSAPTPPLRPWLQQAVRHEKGTWHAVLFAMLLLEGALVAADIAITSFAVTLASTFHTLIVVLAAMIAVIRQRDSDIPKGVRALVYWTFGYLILMFGFGYCYFLFEVIEKGNFKPDEWEWIKTVAATPVWDSPALLVGYFFAVICSTTLGVLGLLSMRKHARANAPRSFEASPPAPLA